LEDSRFVMTDIDMQIASYLVWKDSETLYVWSGENIVEVMLQQSGTPQIVRTIPVGKGVGMFYGICAGEPLVDRDDKLRLGTKVLLAEDAGALVTNTCIFASTASHVIVFDHMGCETARTRTEKTVVLGSIGGDQNTVYGLSGSRILRISQENGSVNIRELCDLKKTLME